MADCRISTSAIGAGSPAIDNPLPPDLIARFCADLERVWNGQGRLGLAVSGGPDSLALLLLARHAVQDKLAVATVDHGLRAESAAEASMVAEICQALGIPHQTLSVSVAPGNLQQEARFARYSALADWMEREGLTALATAHHADDQAETLMMRLKRGSGLSGLAGVRAVGKVPGSTFPLIRPLLGWRKAELEQLVRDAGWQPVDDPSNEDDRFERARIRKALRDADWIDVEALARSASWLGEADQALESLADLTWRERAKAYPEEVRIGVNDDVSRETRFRLLRKAFEHLGSEPRGSQIADLLDALERGETRNLAGLIASASNDEWVLRPEPPRR